MKAQYVKPLICFESFSLSQTIARNCGDTHTGTFGPGSNHYNEYTCSWDVGGFTIFFEHCYYEMEEGEEIEGMCYNNPSGGQEIFSSM